MLQPAYKQWAVLWMAGLGVMPLTSTQRLHHSTFREWSEAQEVQLAIWRPLELWDCVRKGLCIRAHTVDEQKVPKCVPAYVVLWALADRHTCWSTHAMHMPLVVWPDVWPLEAGGAAGCGHLQYFPQLQWDATTSLLLWSPRRQSSSLAGQIFTENSECSYRWVTGITVREHKVWVRGVVYV